MADLNGVLPFFSGKVVTTLDARDRLLKPGGVLIPERETAWVAIVNAPERYRRVVGPWERGCEFDFAAARQRAVNCWTPWRATAAALLVEPKCWTVVDYGNLKEASAQGNVSWRVTQSGRAHGLCMWFDCQTAPGCGFSNSPGSTEQHVYGQAFFPWPEICELEPGDHADVQIRADVVGEDYIWSWNTQIHRMDSHGPIKAQFRQTDFLNVPISADWRLKCNGSFVPSPNREAAVDKMILDLLFAKVSLEEISRQLSDRFPERFPEWRKALSRVGEMSLRYSQ